MCIRDSHQPAQHHGDHPDHQSHVTPDDPVTRPGTALSGGHDHPADARPDQPRHQGHDGSPPPAVTDPPDGTGQRKPSDDDPGQPHQRTHHRPQPPGGHGIRPDGLHQHMSRLLRGRPHRPEHVGHGRQNSDGHENPLDRTTDARNQDQPRPTGTNQHAPARPRGPNNSARAPAPARAAHHRSSPRPSSRRLRRRTAAAT